MIIHINQDFAAGFITGVIALLAIGFVFACRAMAEKEEEKP